MLMFNAKIFKNRLSSILSISKSNKIKKGNSLNSLNNRKLKNKSFIKDNIYIKFESCFPYKRQKVCLIIIIYMSYNNSY